MDVMFDSDSIVVTSLAVTYLTLKNGSKVHCPSNSSKILAKCSKYTVLALMGCGNKQSQGKGHHATVKGRRAKITVQGTSTRHGKYAVMV